MLSNGYFQNKKFLMFAYNALNINYSSRQIIGSGIWESRNTNEIFRALNFYSNK